ncbi:MAG: type II toxin-antitoxin system PemK/MazF family toxin [Sporichthyaceae bacterium]
MRSIHLVRIDKTRPAVVLTRAHMIPLLSAVVVAPITSRIYGISSEVPVGPGNGINAVSVISCDQIQLVSTVLLGRFVGSLGAEQERALWDAILFAFDLDS